MPYYLVGGNITLAGGVSGKLSIKVPVDGAIVKIGIGSTGRVKITDMEITGQPDFFDGVVDSLSLKEHEGTIELADVLPIKRDQSFVITLTDLSGATNDVYIALHIKY